MVVPVGGLGADGLVAGACLVPRGCDVPGQARAAGARGHAEGVGELWDSVQHRLDGAEGDEAIIAVASGAVQEPLRHQLSHFFQLHEPILHDMK